MIAHVRGTVTSINLSGAVIEVGGVGLHVRCTPSALSALRLGKEAILHTTLIVREDSLTVYGFSDADERDMFELVQTASGVGPKVAQAMLAVLSPDRLRQAIGGGELTTLTQVPGIGKKGAERIVVELKDKVGVVAAGADAPAAADLWRDQVHEALVGLGWPTRDADSAVARAADELAPGETPSVPDMLRRALRTLAKER